MIVEDYGCSIPISNTWVTIVIICIPPVLSELIAGVYGCLSIHALYIRSKLRLNITLNSNNNLYSKRYIRLICFSAYDLISVFPIPFLFLYINIKAVVTMPDLMQDNYQYSNVFQLPTVLWRADTITELCFELGRWNTVWAAFVFFAIFGFTEESRNNYRAMLQPVIQVFAKITGIKSRREAEGCVFIFFLSLFSFSVLRLIYLKIFYLESHFTTPPSPSRMLVVLVQSADERPIRFVVVPLDVCNISLTTHTPSSTSQ